MLGFIVRTVVTAVALWVAVSIVPGLSARNAYPGRVASIERPGVDALLRCALDAGGELLARVTPAAVAELGLAPGAPVVLAVKSHSIRLIGPSGRAAPPSSSGSADGTSAAASPGRTPRG